MEQRVEVLASVDAGSVGLVEGGAEPGGIEALDPPDCTKARTAGQPGIHSQHTPGSSLLSKW
ncbi:MAG: hypothetical protein AB7H92_03760 [Microbacteriaceae bacterium]